MKKVFYLTLLFLFFSQPLWAAPPSRSQTYTTGEVISSSEVTENEDNIFNYLQAGVDTIKDGSIVNADVNASAGIQSDKLTLTSIAQDVAITAGGSFDNNGATTLDGTVTVTGTTTFNGATISDLGTVTTGVMTAIDINGGSIDGADLGRNSQVLITNGAMSGGSIDGTTVGSTTQSTGHFSTLKVGTTNQGDVLYDNGTSFVRLTPGTSGQVLQTNGAAANPSWADASNDFSLISATAFDGDGDTGNITIAVDNLYKVIIQWNMGGTNERGLDLRFNAIATASYDWGMSGFALDGTAARVAASGAGDTSIQLTNGNIDLSGEFTAELYINTFRTDAGDDDGAFMIGKVIYETATTGVYAHYDVSGVWLDATNPTSFKVFVDVTTTGGSGTVYLYQLSES